MWLLVDMQRLSSPATGILCSSKLHNNETKLWGFGFRFKLQRRNESVRRRVKLVVSAELSKSFSLNLGLDSQVIQSNDPSQLPWIGPVPGDIAEVEAYCRIFRAAERLHAALMDTLCNPLTGECTVSYEFTPEEKPLLEDKIVSVLGCMLSLLNKGREDVLSGRSSIMNAYRVADISMTEDQLPPLAIFRSEMKRCCESMHIALENYLTPEDVRSLDVWRKLQRLKNVCYDSGFPRGDDYPIHTLFANWSPVYLSNSKDDIASKDSEVTFCRGGQVTEEGLKWLMEKGYKTIVDIRAERVKDNFYEAAIDDAILSGKVELIKIPVEVRTAPTMEQVEKFASLVSNSSKKPLYLHSKEGVWRTYAMVSRWRQYMARCASQISGQTITSNDVLLKDSNRTRKVKASAGKSLLEEKYETVKENQDEIQTKNGVFGFGLSVDMDKKNQSNGAYKGLNSVEGVESAKEVDTAVGSLGTTFSKETDPFKAQVPPSNFVSKKEMSRFFRSKTTSPPRYFNYQSKRMDVLPSEIVSSGPVSGVAETRYSQWSLSGNNLSPNHQNLPAGSEKSSDNNGYVSAGFSTNGFDRGDRSSMTEANLLTSVTKNLDEQVISSSVRDVRRSNGKPSNSGDDDLGPIEGNMCASSTGVVRVQSRKKAEMFLVRTDGFSCNREKVTESSLAFTHPSTQQQMLMWKTTPRTVLVLKKPGPALMEEAKEVASFLYHQEKMNILVEPDVHDIFARIPGFGFVQTFYLQDTSDLHERVDFVACLGGDGVILHASNLFRGAVPPVISFNLGSLGFLTSHPFEDYRQDLRQVIYGNNTLDGVYITLRMRLCCEIFRNGKAMPGKVFDVLNEVVVDRGSNPYLSKIECYEHDRLITKVQGDGVIVATPTGSTAYSTAAGGSMIPDDARSNAWVSFDGKRRQQLSRGDSVRIFMSEHPIPTVNKSDQTGDWFHSLVRCLNWNERLDQKAL
ncbi:NAD kinase 2 [Citrus sinensis]|nr:NAD kinase 2 [Citrus sinensis]